MGGGEPGGFKSETTTKNSGTWVKLKILSIMHLEYIVVLKKCVEHEYYFPSRQAFERDIINIF